VRELPFERRFRAWAGRAGVGWETLRYPRPEAGGETLAHRLTPPGGPPRGVVLTVHGAGNDALFAMVGLFKRLLLRRFEVFTFDLDGHGRAGTTSLAAETAPSALPAAIEASGARERGLALHALGISLGGSVLLHSLPDLEDVASAILVCAPLRIRFRWRAVAGELRRPSWKALWREREHYGLTGLVPSFGPFKREVYPLRLAEPPGPGSFAYVEALNRILSELRLEERAASVGCPVLLVYGSRDGIVPLSQGERLARTIPDAHLLPLIGETHLSTPMAPAAVEGMLRWVEEGRRSSVFGLQSLGGGPGTGPEAAGPTTGDGRPTTDDRRPTTDDR
jgi:pimeloyl-ACP methyl ester carboxylesterase